ncbi:MAG: hypothetical protein ACLFTI_11085 [Anaerolineales bacterium]
MIEEAAREREQRRREIIARGPRTIGDWCIALDGYDARELLMAGYTVEQLHGILRGEYTLEELRQTRPARRPQR